MSAAEATPCPEQLPPPELSIYRDHCLALLHRYFMMSVEVGRLPALLGREVFRTRARSYRLTSFEDTVIFVHDVEACLRRLDRFDHELITRIVFQEYTQEEAAALMGCTRQTVINRFPEALDSLSEIFISVGLLRPQTRHYRHRPADDSRFDLQGCATDTIADLGCNLLHTGRLSENLVKPPAQPIFAVST